MGVAGDVAIFGTKKCYYGFAVATSFYAKQQRLSISKKGYSFDSLVRV